MEQSYQTEFTRDLENIQIISSRRFYAPIELVWKSWTDHNLIDQWWAPKPYQAITTRQSFEEGGFWLYYMQGPESQINWCRKDYEKIEEPFFYSAYNGFCDEQGNVNEDIPRGFWEVYFSGEEDGTRVKVIVTFSAAEDMDKIIEMGFLEGFASAHKNLDLILIKETEVEEE